MEVILLEAVHKLGELGQKVKVRPGYGRNYLIPNKKAVPATTENIATFESRRTELEKAQKESLGIAKLRAEQLDGMSVTITRKAGAEGKLYGSVGTADIAEAISVTGIELAKQEISMPTGTFRNIGEYVVDIQLQADVTAKITVVVSLEEE